jgi:predicted ATPase
MRRDLPTGTVTFVFTDIEGSTRMLAELGSEQYADVLSRHHASCREAWAAHGGVEVDTAGDAFFVAFPTASGALRAARDAQGALAELGLGVRMGVHTGEVNVTETGYVGLEVHRAARIAAAAHGGQIVVSASTAALAGSDGLVELGKHRFKDIDEPIAIFQLGDGTFPPLKTISNTNLPNPASSFIGREGELAEVLAKFEHGARLVTLTGTGGSGKTRLALEVAATLVPRHRDGVFWVGLAALRDPNLVLSSVAQVLGARNGVSTQIGDRELLLLLDNFEQVIDAAPDISALLVSCPNLALLVTSRELLRVDGEVEFGVPPLAAAEAVALFCTRAQTEPSGAIRELCARLDHLPLAVELAAARTKALSPAQILARLSRRLDLLAAGRDADPRQQTLRATIEWSYDLLSPEERRLFRALSVFAGGCTLEAAEEVAGADVDTLQSLVEKSLLRFTDERYWMLETIREYAGERLGDSEEDAAVVLGHGRFFLDLAASHASAAGHVVEAGAVRLLSSERDNLRAAIAAAGARRDLPFVATALGLLWPVLLASGNAHEGAGWARFVLAERDHLSDGELRSALKAGGELLRHVGEVDEAEMLKLELVELVELGSPADDRPMSTLMSTLADLSDMALVRGDVEGARAYAARALAVDAHSLRALYALAEVELQDGDFESAETHFAECATGFEGVHDFNYGFSLEALGESARRRGDAARARALFLQAARHFADLGDQACVADCLDGLAAVAVAGGAPEQAGILAGAADRMRTEWGRPAGRNDRPLDGLPETAREKGRSLSLEEAMEFAVASID